MLSFNEFDLIVGKDVVFIDSDGRQLTKIKEIENSYLEEWLKYHQLAVPSLSVAKYYRGCALAHLHRREADGKLLTYTNRDTGYFFEQNTEATKLIQSGDSHRKIEPIYADNERAAHNAVAYGALIMSDGVAQTHSKQGQSRILVVDDERRSIGDAPLLDRHGKKIPAKDLEDLFDKMGDGTMLVPTRTMHELLLEKEIRQGIERGIKKSTANENLNAELGEIGEIIDEAFGDEIDPELTDNLLAEWQQTGKISSFYVDLTTGLSIQKQLDAIARARVVQFRAATPDLPGMAKGTMSSSAWCERLGVDAIVSTNDIKGDDGRLKTPGIRQLDSYWWCNRKATAQWGYQSVGPQVKRTIPEATLNELNPIAIAKSAELAEIGADIWQLAQRYVAKQEGRRVFSDRDEDDEINSYKESLVKLIKADSFGQLLQHGSIRKRLERSLRIDRLDAALSGVEVPAATAQSHGKLRPWEICNRDLPDGAVVVFYRSPFPSVAAAAICVNNLQAIKEGDPEAYYKQGVAYLNPWTAKAIAITDFDGDRNGFFVGYLGGADLPQQLRNELPRSGNSSELYEAARAKIGQLISQLEPGDFPQSVAEFIAANAPDRQPPAISKAPKIPHPWRSDEFLSDAIFRAWAITADNPTAMVANQSMVLSSFAAETKYIAPELKFKLFEEIGSVYQNIPPGSIPSNYYLEQKGMPKLDLRERMQNIVNSYQQRGNIPIEKRETFATQWLDEIGALLQDYNDACVATNLQTAVDNLKSSQGIDEQIHEFGKQLQYKPHLLRQNSNRPDIYSSRPLPTNTQEPIAWAVEAANLYFEESRDRFHEHTHEEPPHLQSKHHRKLIPPIHSERQLENFNKFLTKYVATTEQLNKVKNRQSQNLREDTQPTLTIHSATGKHISIQRLCDIDPQGLSPLWQIAENERVRLELNASNSSSREKFIAYLIGADDRKTTIGFVSPDSAKELHLERYDFTDKGLPIPAATIEFYVPYNFDNEVQSILNRGNQLVDEIDRAIGERSRAEYASAAWRSNAGMGVATKIFVEQIVPHLDSVPPLYFNQPNKVGIELGNRRYIQPDPLQAIQPTEGTAVTLRIERNRQYSLIDRDGNASPIGEAGDDYSPILSPGTVVEARIYRAVNPKIFLDTEWGRCAISPCDALKREIKPTTGKFVFQSTNELANRNKPPEKQDYSVSFVADNGKRYLLGILGKEVINQDFRPKIQTDRVVNGRMFRQLSDALTIQIDRVITHQPMARVDRGELVPLPDGYSAKPTLLGERHAVGEDVPFAKRLRQEKAETAPYEKATSRARFHPLRERELHSNIADISQGNYQPTIQELREIYLRLKDCSSPEVLAEIADLGQQLKNLYPEPDRVPGDFSHPSISFAKPPLWGIDPKLRLPKKDPQISEFKNSSTSEFKAKGKISMSI